MDELKKKVEAILFSIGKFISLEEISSLCRSDPKKVKEALLELTSDYEGRSLTVINDDDQWKLTTREEYGKIVRKVVTETELTKSQLETLAVIAFKYPIKQSDLIRIRTNKAYDHLMELEKSGFISRQRYGRSKLIRLTDKFFEYFDLPKEKLKERFKGFDQLAHTIESKEREVESAKEMQKKAAEEAKKQAEKERKVMDGEIEVEEYDEPAKVETYDAEKKETLEEVKDTLGNLEVVDEPEEVLENDGSDDVKGSGDAKILQELKETDDDAIEDKKRDSEDVS